MDSSVVLRLVLFGAPGAGKGTQAELLCERFGLLHISTGDIFREAMRQGTPMGKIAQTYIDGGNLVPDEIVIGLVADCLEDRIGPKGFIFDGFPRTIPQAEMLDAVLLKSSRPLSAVLSLEVPTDVLVRRISGRRVCPNCASAYHVDTLPQGQITCPKDGTLLVQRKDDKESAVETRLEAFARQTLPLKAFYEEKKLLLSIDGVGSPQEVLARTISSLGEGF